VLSGPKVTVEAAGHFHPPVLSSLPILSKAIELSPYLYSNLLTVPVLSETWVATEVGLLTLLTTSSTKILLLKLSIPIRQQQELAKAMVEPTVSLHINLPLAAVL
jgi:hypothetical protein